MTTEIVFPGPPFVPCLGDEAVTFLESILQPDLVVFEYGSGSSTVFLAQRVKHMVTVEDALPFYRAVKNLLAELDLKAHLLFFEEAGKSEGILLDSYIHSIGVFPNNFFDVVFCDGTDISRSRTPKVAKPKVKPGGWLIIDDVDWDPARRGMDNAKLDNWEAIFLCGEPLGRIPGVSIGPRYQTTGFFRKPTP